jgi:hypothetical protein
MAWLCDRTFQPGKSSSATKNTEITKNSRLLRQSMFLPGGWESLLRQCVFSVIFVISVANQLPFLGSNGFNQFSCGTTVDSRFFASRAAAAV